MASQLLAVCHLALFSVAAMLLGTIFVVLIRAIGRFPAEFDRLGADISLYGYGVIISLATGRAAGRTVLNWLPERMLPLFILLAGVLMLTLYGVTFAMSSWIRGYSADHEHGVNTPSQLREAFAVARCKRIFLLSIVLGLMPTATFVILDIASDLFGGI